MIDHITLRVKNIETTKSFYLKTLQPLGYSLTAEMEFDAIKIIGFGKNNKTDTWFTTDKPVSAPLHICWKAESKEQVDAFYEEAIFAGGKDNGKPGIRTEYHENYYGAFVLDPDGNNIEAVFGNT